MTIKGSTLNSYQLLNTNSSLVHNRCLSVIGIDNYKHSCNFTDFSSSYFFVRNAAVTLSARAAREAQGLLAPWPWRSSRARLTRCQGGPGLARAVAVEIVTTTPHAVPMEVKAPVPEKGHGAVTLSARAAREAQGLLAVPGVVGADGIMRPIHAILQNARGEIKNLVLPTYKKG